VSLDENKDEMSESLSSIKTGQVTFAIKDTTIEGVEVKKDFYMALSGKQILLSVEDKFVALKELVKSMVNEMSSIVTLIYGEDVNSDDAEAVVEELEVSYPDVEFELVEGNQPVYSFIIGVE
jgi:dihydroxyacetone kinase-like predicted kinase